MDEALVALAERDSGAVTVGAEGSGHVDKPRRMGVTGAVASGGRAASVLPY